MSSHTSWKNFCKLWNRDIARMSEVVQGVAESSGKQVQDMYAFVSLTIFENANTRANVMQDPNLPRAADI